MRGLLIFLAGLVVGAALFHAVYVGQKPTVRCAIDHPFDRDARDLCAAEASFKGYAKGARKQLDKLIDDLDH